MQLKSILNHVEKMPGFVVANARWGPRRRTIEFVMRARANNRPRCSGCGKRASKYGTLRTRHFQFIPLWQIPVDLVYAMRRVNCRTCGVCVEQVPWADGKQRSTKTFQWFLAAWAQRLSWEEVATVFGTSWNRVREAVKQAVDWGRERVDVSSVTAVGVDEIMYRSGSRLHKGPEYMTLVYQIDENCKRLLWIGHNRTEQVFQGFFDWFDSKKHPRLKFVCSDMWKPYLKVIRERVPAATHILDRFHIMAKINVAIDVVRSKEAKELRKKEQVGVLAKSRWLFLKRPENLSDAQHEKLRDLLTMNLRIVRAYLLKEGFQRFWSYTSPYWAGRFLDSWCERVMASRIEPMKAIAKTLRKHRPLLLNWFAAKAISTGAVEGLNNKAKVTMRRAYGYRSYKIAELALYHSLGNLPVPKFTHRFW